MLVIDFSGSGFQRMALLFSLPRRSIGTTLELYMPFHIHATKPCLLSDYSYLCREEQA